jgi:hypothetical protein
MTGRFPVQTDQHVRTRECYGLAPVPPRGRTAPHVAATLSDPDLAWIKRYFTDPHSHFLARDDHYMLLSLLLRLQIGTMGSYHESLPVRHFSLSAAIISRFPIAFPGFQKVFVVKFE